jgi:hypothetical protein
LLHLASVLDSGLIAYQQVPDPSMAVQDAELSTVAQYFRTLEQKLISESATALRTRADGIAV